MLLYMFMYMETLTVVLYIRKMIIIVNRLSFNIAFKPPNILRLLSPFLILLLTEKKKKKKHSLEVEAHFI